MKTRTKTRTIPKTPFFAAFSVGAVLFSAHAGGGFATGNQANTYYVGLGWAGIVSAMKPTSWRLRRMEKRRKHRLSAPVRRSARPERSTPLARSA